jgi:tRNA nucleotidyltransferase (CCA-adding enzyme)
MKIYQVGGAVRDKLLNHPNKDRDWVVVGASPEMLLKLGYTPVGRDFPVFLHPNTHEEYALARTERKTKPGYTGFNVYAAPEVTLTDDLQRRDLTINAMALDNNGQLIDPFNGLSDLRAGILRHVSSAFVEDPVRILRVARFTARFGFSIAQETLALMAKMVENGEVDALVAERVWQETVRALGEPRPQQFFEVLRSCGALARIFPEIDRLFDVPQSTESCSEPFWCLQQARLKTSDTQILFAVLTYDLAQETTSPKEWRGIELLEALCQRYPVPNQYRDLAILVARFHTHCQQVSIRGFSFLKKKLKPRIKFFEEKRLASNALSPEALLDTLQQLDAFRRPQRFEQFLFTVELCGCNANQPDSLEIFRRAYEIACQVDVAAVLADGFQKAAIGEELRRRRVQALAQFLLMVNG